MLASETKNLLLVFSGLVIFTVTTLLVLSYPTYIYQDVAGQIQTRSTSQCAPILINKRQYKIKLNGEVYPKSVQNMYNSSINFDCLNTRSNSTVRKRLILAWNNLFGANYYKNGFRKAGCPVTNCELTSDRSRLNEAELVLCHMREINGENNLPKTRPKSQRWVFVLLESPVHGSVGNFSSYNGFFNLTATYRIDSDFSHYYDGSSGMVWQDNSQNFDKNRDFFSDKLKEVAAVVSNCRAKNRRLEIVKQLNESIQVDLFGKCGEKCPEKFSDGKVADCKQVLGREYKFYLAFENSFCKDYITEKFHGILRYDIIPVVFGSGEYERFVRFKFLMLLNGKFSVFIKYYATL